MKKNLLSNIFILTGFIYVLAGYSFASNGSPEPEVKCAMPNFERAYKNAAAVFVGEVVSIEKDGDTRTFKFRVKKYWKGIEDTTVKVTAHENRRYQAPFKKGESFLVFAKSNEGKGLWDGRCSRTRNMESYSPSKEEDLEQLGEAKTCIDLVKSKQKEDKTGEQAE